MPPTKPDPGSMDRPRPASAAIPRPTPPATTPRATPPRPQQRQQRPDPARVHRSESRGDQFHNPYNFVPAVPRADMPEDEHGSLRDQQPAWHDRLHAPLWTGRIAVRMTTITPLIIPDNGVEKDRHRTYGTRTEVDADGVRRVHLAGSAVKGMLRSAYEAATNSRLGVFEQDKPMGFRTDETYPRRLVPALATENGRLTLCRGLRVFNRRPMGAVRVPRYEDPEPAYWQRYGLAHGSHVEAWVEFHGRSDTGIGAWYVLDARPAGLSSDFAAPRGSWPILARVEGFLHVVNKGTGPKTHERLFVTKLLAADSGVTLSKPKPAEDVASGVWESFKKLIGHYRDKHVSGRRNEVWGRTTPEGKPVPPWEYLADEPGKTAWSRHLYEMAKLTSEEKKSWNVSETDIAAQGRDFLAPPPGPITCFAELDRKDRVIRLVPVQITRLLHEHTPDELLDEGIKRATNLLPTDGKGGLSPADRVFGWVAQEDDPAEPTDPSQASTTSPVRTAKNEGRDRTWGSNLRIGPVFGPAIESADANAKQGPEFPLQQMAEPLALEILSAPKPAQGRFYVGDAGPDGTGVPGPLPPDAAKQSFFATGRRLRGRKVYPHQRAHEKDPDYWAADKRRTDQEYRRLDGTQDDQNRSVTSWVKPGQEFRFTVDVRNLSDHELGALLWLLDPARLGTDDHPGYHRLGAGKPFGFGSVRVEAIPKLTDLRRGEAWREDILSLGATPAPTEPGWDKLATGFEQAMRRAPHGVIILDAVRRAAAGFSDGRPVHYPRATRQRTPEGENFKWFVRNEELATAKFPRATSLPALGPARPNALPYQGTDDPRPKRR